MEISIDREIKGQINRLNKYPLKVPGKLIVLDRLEGEGYLGIYEHTTENEPFYFLNYDYITCVKGATLVGKIRISTAKEKKTIVVKEIFYKKGHEEIRNALVAQVLGFIDFYDQYEKIRIHETAFEDWANGFGELCDEYPNILKINEVILLRSAKKQANT